jgi:hypothetical protein
MNTKLFKFTWQTNYGESVALVEALDKDEAISLFEPGILWDGYDCEEVILTGTSHIISIEGGE